MERLVTLFGGGGFLGRYVAQQLYNRGYRVRTAQRDPRSAYFLKPLGGVGQSQFVAVDIRDRERVARVVQGSDAVVNLIGVLKGDFQGLHVDGARNVAEACAAANVPALVHISAIGAAPDSRSAYGRSKAEGEQAVRAAFPNATIIRPSILFGREDAFINRFAGLARLLPVLPVIRADVKLQPVFVADAAKAVAAAALDPDTHGGQDYELGGPQQLSMRALMQWICATTGRQRRLLEIPDGVASMMARLTGWLPAAPITWDQWLMLQKDNIVADNAQGLAAFNIPATPMATVAEGWLSSYRRNGRFAARSSY